MKIFISRYLSIMVMIFFVFDILPLQTVQAGHALSVFSQLTFDCASVSEIPQEECNALLAFYNSTGGADWTNNSGWLISNTPCSWYGLTCGNSTNVTVLSFSSNNLLGNIPPEIGNLTLLQDLSLNGNQLSGNLPAEISALNLVTNLDIGYNMLTVSDPTLLTYLDTKDSDWATTQTIPPSNVQVVFTTSTSIELSWTAISYISDGGYYEVGWATNLAGPYTLHGVTSNKSASGYVLNNMSPGENYHIRIRTFTPSHAMQQSALWSEYTPPISASAVNPIPVLNGILPDHKDAGDGGFDLILEGSNFTSDAKALWNGVELATTFSTSGRISAAVPALLLQSPGLVDVIVRNPAPGGGTSNTLPFNVNPYTNSWMAHSPEGGVINDIEVDSSNPLVMYAATEVAGVYKSVDGGQNWFAVNNGINAAGPLVDIVVSPSNSSIVMASGAETFISRNGGASWVDLLYNGNMSTNCIKFDAQDSNTITLGTSHGLLQTKDGGNTWKDIGKFPGHYIFAVEVDPQNPGTIYEIDIDPDNNHYSVWKTTDSGTSWNQLIGLPVSISHLKMDLSNSSVLYAATMNYGTAAEYGIYKSVDGGTTWIQVVSDSLHYTSIVIDGSDPNQVYVAADNGVYRTSDGGLNWEFNMPPKYRDVLSLAIAKANPSVLFGAGFHGVFKSLDSGVTWSPINTGLYAHQIKDLAYSTDSNTLFAATFQGGVWQSADYGASWSHIDQDMPFLRLLRMDPKNTDHLFVSAAGGFLESTDGGQTWTPRYFTFGMSLFSFAANSDLLAVTSDGPFGPEHVYKSVDNGNTWVKKSDLPICFVQCRTSFLVADPVDPNTFYASAYAMDSNNMGYAHLYKTSDGGESWVESDTSAWNEIYQTIAIDPINTSILYLGGEFGIYKSIDSGGNWEKVHNYGPIAMAVDPTNSQIVYAGGIGVYRSVDGGATWADFNYGLNSSVVWTILPLPAPLPPPVAGMRRNALATAPVGSVNRVYSIAGGMVYAYFTAADNALPFVNNIVRASASPTSALTVNFTVTFSKFVTGVKVVAPFTDFDLTTSPGITGAFVTGVTPVSGTTYTVSVNTGSGNGTIRLDVVDDNSIVDAASHPLGGTAVGDGNYTGGEIYTINKPFTPASKWTSSFDLSHGWTVSQYVRTVGDVNNDGRDDLIGFGLDGVYVALSTGSGFGAVSKWSSSFDLSHGWTVSQFVRTVGDVNNDGRDDLIGFGLDGVYVALSNGTSFDPISKWTSSFDLSHGWTVAGFVRTVGDVNNDGRDDLIGFGLDGVYVALSNGTSFGSISKWSSSFDLSHGWTVSQFVRTVGDANFDGRDDLIGFGLDGVYVALSNGTSFGSISKWSSSFDLSHGWTVAGFVRTLGDVNFDGRDDLIGFGLDSVYVALANGASFDPVSRWTNDFDLSHGWTVNQYVRTIGDVNNDGKADLVGFGLDGVYVATAK